MEPYYGNPLAAFFHKLSKVKSLIKTMDWSSSTAIEASLMNLQDNQNHLLSLLDSDPTNFQVNSSLKQINSEIAALTSWDSWIKQRAKENWLKQGEDDLKFLYSKIQARKNFNGSLCYLLWKGIHWELLILSPMADSRGGLWGHQNITKLEQALVGKLLGKKIGTLNIV
ncbi:hypothetical protein M5K25_024006 [Dendrobium thyrsiflorum]|uniref:Uncharacterized protein n=1 Tax=Dendrobium thyrsiflorum TaxID=117978 RepID=A0ABD0U168_DENTH